MPCAAHPRVEDQQRGGTGPERAEEPDEDPPFPPLIPLPPEKIPRPVVDGFELEKRVLEILEAVEEVEVPEVEAEGGGGQEAVATEIPEREPVIAGEIQRAPPDYVQEPIREFQEDILVEELRNFVDEPQQDTRFREGEVEDLDYEPGRRTAEAPDDPSDRRVDTNSQLDNPNLLEELSEFSSIFDNVISGRTTMNLSDFSRGPEGTGSHANPGQGFIINMAERMLELTDIFNQRLVPRPEAVPEADRVFVESESETADRRFAQSETPPQSGA